MAKDVNALFLINGSPITIEVVVYALVMSVITIVLIVTSCLTIGILLNKRSLRDIVGCYLCSLATSDLVCGVFVTPFSIYSALDPRWKFSGDESWMCKIEAYLGITLWISQVFIFVWISVDRFTALKRPQRYEAEQTFTRCKCYIVFAWITALLLSSPVVVANMKAVYNEDIYLCVLDWSATKAYSATLALLVTGPSVISILYSYCYIVRSATNPQRLSDPQKTVLENDASYMLTLFVILSFTLCWLPWFVVKLFDQVLPSQLDIKPLHFSLIWLGIGGSTWRFLIYTIMSADFRKGIGYLWDTLCCNLRTRKAPGTNQKTRYQPVVLQNQRYI